MSARAERRAIVALFAAFALIVQALVPSLATAAPGDAPFAAICTGQALKAAAFGQDAPSQPMPAQGCEQCLFALTAAPPPAPVTVRPVAYALAAALITPAVDRRIPRARAPPRPPGQGPPTSNV